MEKEYSLYDLLKPQLAKSIASLRDDTHAYWAWPKDSRLNESNLTFHVGHHLKNAGFQIYLEVPVLGKDEGEGGDVGKKKQGKSQRFDALALHPHLKQGIIIESKYLFSKTAASLSDDIIRMMTRGPLSRFGELSEYNVGHGLILVHTWCEEVWKWWKNPIGCPEGETDTRHWATISKALANGLHDGEPIIITKEKEKCWMMWAFFSLK